MPQKGPRGQTQSAQERRLQAFELRKGGATYRQIAQTLGVSEAQAHRDVMGRGRFLAALEGEAREHHRQLDQERLDALLLGLWARATAGDPESVRAFVRVLERRARLLGLDAAQKHEVTGKDGKPLIPLEALRAVLADTEDAS